MILDGDNKFSALNSAVWSAFIYARRGPRDIPLQAYFHQHGEHGPVRAHAIVDEDAYVHYVELHRPDLQVRLLHPRSSIIVKKAPPPPRSRIEQRLQPVTKRAVTEEGATGWVDGNIGSVTMKYPAVWMTGPYAKGEVLSVAFAGEGQFQDTGAKMTHMAPYTSSNIVSKSVARGGGRAAYRGLVQVNANAHHSYSNVECDALLVDNISRSDTYPYNDIRNDHVVLGHEATVSQVSEDQLFYLMSRGLKEEEAMAMIVRGFVEPIAKELPMEYALELNRLIELQMEGSVG